VLAPARPKIAGLRKQRSGRVTLRDAPAALGAIALVLLCSDRPRRPEANRHNVKTPPYSAAPPTSWRESLLLAAICAAVLVFYFWKCSRYVSELGRDEPGTQYYNLLIDGFSAGQLNLNVDAPAGLSQLPDPWDPQANFPFRRHPFAEDRLHDTSYFRGKLYLYFGVTPALLLFWPYHAITGGYLSHSMAVAIFSGAGFLVSVGLLRALRRRYFPATPVPVVGAGAVALGLANSVPVMMWRPDVWEVPISCGYALLAAALAGLWAALHDTRRGARWLAVASAALGLAVGARPFLLLAVPILLFPLLAWRAGARRGEPVPAAGRALAAALGPLALAGFSLALYNHFRFESPFEFGQRYQLAGDRQDVAQSFSPGYAGYNLRLYFLSLSPWQPPFPFVRDVAVPAAPAGHAGTDMPYGVLTHTPVALFALAVPLLWLRRPGADALRAFVAAVAVAFTASALTVGAFYYACTRYQVDFHPWLVLLGVTGACVAWERARRPASRRLVVSVVIGAAAFSAVVSLLKSYQGTADHLAARGRAAEARAEYARAASLYDQAIAFDPRRIDPRFYAAVLQQRLGNVSGAITHYEALVRLAPHHAIALNNLADLLRVEGRHDDAIGYLLQAIRVRPELAEAYVNLGVALYEVGRHADAVRPLEEAMRLRPELAEARYFLSIALYATGRVQEAREHHAQARRLKPDLPELRL
jgi:Flp pilus assembly protein TadD